MAIAAPQTRVPLEVKLERRRRTALRARELRAWLAAETNDTANVEAQLHHLELEVRNQCTHLRRMLMAEAGKTDGAAMHAALFSSAGDPTQRVRARVLLDELGWGSQARAVAGSYQLIDRVRAAPRPGSAHRPPPAEELPASARRSRPVQHPTPTPSPQSTDPERTHQ